MNDRISRFYAVTSTSVYEVSVSKADGVPRAVKIAARGVSDIGVGHSLEGGTMIAVCKFLVTYIPEGSGAVSPRSTIERKIENVNTQWWGGKTSPIVALFKIEGDARDCICQSALMPCDPRWLGFTKQVVEEIGEDHPAFEVCRHPSLALIPA